MPQSRILIKGVHVVDVDKSVMTGDPMDILIEDSKIAKVEREVVEPQAEVVEGKGMVAMPGMADTHTHLWESLFRGRVSEAWGMEYFSNIPPLGSHLSPEDMYNGVYSGAIELLHNGVTFVLDFCHSILSPEHADAAVRALRDSGIRALFAYDLTGRDPAGRGSLGPSAARFDDIERVAGELSQGDGTVRLGVGLSAVTPDSMDRVREEITFSRGISAQMTFHNNAGGELVLLDRAGLLDKDILPAHCNSTTDEDLDLLAVIGGFISTQPEAETYAGRRPYSMVGRAHKRGIGVALGVDVPALVNPGILTQMRLLYLLQRYMDGVHERYEAQVPIARRPGWPQLSTRDVLRAGTANGLAAVGLGDRVGHIAPGYEADIVLLSTDPFGLAEGCLSAHIVMNTSQAEIDSVIVAGRFLKKNGQLVGIDTKQTLAERLRSRANVLDRAGEIGAGPMSETWWPWVKTNP